MTKLYIRKLGHPLWCQRIVGSENRVVLNDMNVYNTQEYLGEGGK